jgi:uncharacterized membrane protein
MAAGAEMSRAYAVLMSVLLVVLHVVAGVFIVGPMAILPMIGMRALRTREAGQVANLAKSTNLLTLLSLVVVFLGFGALGVSDPKDNFTFASTWVWLSLVAYAIALVLNLVVVVPALRSSAESLADGTAGDGRLAGYSRISAGSGIVSLLLVLIVVLMVWKP